MGEELAEEQLKDFCQRHGLAKDGYLDETELTTVCQCIGLQVSTDIIKELFEELDGDKDGRVCLSELTQMFKGMQDKLPPSPEKHNKMMATPPDANNSPPRAPGVGKGTTNGFTTTNNIPVTERGAFSILDPENTGFAKVGMVLDLWNQLGVCEADGCRLLSDLGFSSKSKSQPVNLQDLAKSVEDETDHSKEKLPLAFQVALVTYRTEAQFLKTLCESIECERDKLKADIVDAHQRSALIAQEVDEQNARLERNSQMVLRKMEMKYNEQIQDLQDRFSTEKESLQQALHVTEKKLKELQDEDNKLKLQINKLNDENSTLEKELQSLNIEIRSVNRMRSHLEREVSRFIGVENQLQEMERKYMESLANSDGKLKDTYTEMQALRDQNDELTMQLETVRETLKLVQASQSKEKRFVQKKRKGSSSSPLSNHHNHHHNNNHQNNSSALNSPSSSLITSDSSHHGRADGEDVPVNKMGKYYSKHDEDTEECDSSLEHVVGIPAVITSGSSNNNSLEHVVANTAVTGTCPKLPSPIAIRIAACIGESSTDGPIIGNGRGSCVDDVDGEEMDSEPSLSALEERLLMGQSERECASLESEMCAVANRHRVARHFSLGSGVDSHTNLFRHYNNFNNSSKFETMTIRTVEEKGVQYDIEQLSFHQDMMTQTEESGDSMNSVEQLKARVTTLEKDISDNLAAYEKEKGELKVQCSELENSLQLLREEYDKCEDYWQDKLHEARDMYEQDKQEIDEKFQDLLGKIKEYEELLLSTSSNNDRLPPIEERASLERQVTDLEEECEVLRNKITSVKMEQESVITTYQRSFETKLKEECANLEQQVSALSKKCQEYENRLSALAEEERSTVEESGMMDLMKERIKQLELQLRSQEERFKQQVGLLEATLKEREILYKKSIPEIPKPLSPQFGHNHWNHNELISQSKSKSLLEMLQNSQKPESIWPQRFASVGDKSSSLPFIPAVQDPSMALQPGAWGSLSPPFQPENASSWGTPPTSSSRGSGGGVVPTMKKAWAHVELNWLQSLRAKLKQRDEQCYLLQRALQQKDSQTEKIVTELKYQHEMEISNWESLMQASQELLRQHVVKHKEQAEKLAHSDLLMKDLWVENAKLMAALNATEQRVIQLENLLKFQMTTSANNSHHHHNNHLHQQNIHNNLLQQHHHQHQHAYSSPSSPHHHGSPSSNLLHPHNQYNNNNNNSSNNAILSAPLSLPHQSSHFHI